MDPKKIAELKAALDTARTRLSLAPDQDRLSLEAEVGRKSAALSEAERQADEERQAARVATLVRAQQKEESDRAATVQAEAEQTAKAEQERLDTLVQARVDAELTKRETAASGRKFVHDSGDGDDDGDANSDGEGVPDAVRAQEGRKGGGAFAGNGGQGQGQGRKSNARVTQKDSFGRFLIGIARKDDDYVARVQKGHGIQLGADQYIARNGYGGKSMFTTGNGSMDAGMGGKALVEGQGMIDPVAGPNGGYVVPVEWSEELIPLLYPWVVVRRAGARVMPMTSPIFRQPRMTGGATATYEGETQPIVTSQETLDQFALNAKILTAMVPVSRFLLMDAPMVSQVVKDDASEQIGRKEDVSFLVGVGTSTTPQGILTAAGTTHIAPAANGDAPSYKMLVQMITALRKSNVPRQRRVWIGPPDIQGAFLGLPDANGRPIFAEYNDVNNQQVIDDNNPNAPDGYLLGYPFYSTTQLPVGPTGTAALTASLAFAEMSQVVIGDMGEIEIDTFNEGGYRDGSGTIVLPAQQNLVVYRIVTRHDVGVRRSAGIIVHDGIIVS